MTAPWTSEHVQRENSALMRTSSTRSHGMLIKVYTDLRFFSWAAECSIQEVSVIFEVLLQLARV
jgi:hypothetical protein